MKPALDGGGMFALHIWGDADQYWLGNEPVGGFVWFPGGACGNVEPVCGAGADWYRGDTPYDTATLGAVEYAVE